MFNYGADKVREWENFLAKLGVETFLTAINDSTLYKILPQINETLTEEPAKIAGLRLVFSEYNSTPYSIEKSKEVVLQSIKKLMAKYSQREIPLVYTTLSLPTPSYFSSSVARELFGIKSFEKEDYGHLNFLEALLELMKEKAITIKSFDVLNANYELMVFKAVIEYREPVKEKSPLITPAMEKLWAKPIIKRFEAGHLPYMGDELFYSLWKYANASRLTGKNLISFDDLTPFGADLRFSVYRFLLELQELKMGLENITFHTDIYKKFCEPNYAGLLEEYTKQNPNKEASKSIRKLFQNNATFEDVLNICKPFNGITNQVGIEGVLDFIEFSNPTEIKSLKDKLNAYLECFIEDKLFSPELINFYRFSRQKEIFLYQIESKIEDYGVAFVFKQGKSVSVVKNKGKRVTINKDNAYLFIHTLAALEKLGFFEVESLLIVDMEAPPEDQTNDYKIKIQATEKLLNEYKKQDEVEIHNKPNAIPETANSVEENLYPKVIIDNGFCYLKVSKTQQIKIGKIEARKALLAKSLGENFGLPKAVDVVFEEIRLSRDSGNPLFENPNTAHTNKLDVMRMTTKEINRKLGVGKKLHLKINNGYIKTVKFEWW